MRRRRFFLVLILCLPISAAGGGWFPSRASSTSTAPHKHARGGGECEGMAADEADATLRALGKKLKGDVVLLSPGDASSVQELTWSKPTPVPRAIVRPANEEDVRAAVPVLAELRRRNGVDLRVKSGGHHYNAFSSTEGGVVLDLARLNSYKICRKRGDGDGDVTTAWIGPAVDGGTVWKDLVKKRGLGAIMGGCPAVNQGGFLLGGGFSYWSRLYGLGCDRVRQARAVLPDGTLIVANATNQHADLFWALRGAGSAGIGAVVTSFEVELFPTQDEQVYGMGKIPSVDETAAFLSKLSQSSLPGNFGFSLFLFPEQFFGPDFVAFYNWYDTGIENLKSGVEVLNTTMHDMLSEETANQFHAEVKSATEHSKGGLMDGRLWRTWNGFLMPEQCKQTTVAKLLALLKDIRDEGEGFVTVEILLWGGAIEDVKPHETAFYWRRGRYNVAVNLGVPLHVSNANDVFDRQQALIDNAWRKVERYLKGCYYNYPERDASLGDYFEKNVARLRRVKRRYDPDGTFGHPQSF